MPHAILNSWLVSCTCQYLHCIMAWHSCLHASADVHALLQETFWMQSPKQTESFAISSTETLNGVSCWTSTLLFWRGSTLMQDSSKYQRRSVFGYKLIPVTSQTLLTWLNVLPILGSLDLQSCRSHMQSVHTKCFVSTLAFYTQCVI